MSQGKPRSLTALRDFDLEDGEKPATPEYWPDERDNVRPRVSVQFEVDAGEIERALWESNFVMPSGVSKAFRESGSVWITRHLPTGKYELTDDIRGLWGVGDTEEPPPESASAETAEASAESNLPPDPPPDPPIVLGADELGAQLRWYWPAFVYFDSFSNQLPRSVPFSDLQQQEATPKPVAASGAGKQKTATVPRAVLDLIALSNVDLGRVEELSQEEKRLDNYLKNKSAEITGDFLTYWTQTVDGAQTVDLRVEGRRGEQGELRLHFFVFDGFKHYPEQRSKGFLWFLSFYLRLTASQKREPDRAQFLLIDEPGSYLHARAQRDVLKLLEEKLVKKDQILYSTHSPVLIPADRLHRVRLVIRDPQEGTLILNRLTDRRIKGDVFQDTLSPILAAIGLDVREALTFARPKNLLVEGISDHFYLSGLARVVGRQLCEDFMSFLVLGQCQCQPSLHCLSAGAYNLWCFSTGTNKETAHGISSLMSLA